MAFCLKNKKRELLTAKHPLHREDESLKLPYLLGIALLFARVDNDLAQAEREALAELIYVLDLPEGRLEMILAKVQEADQGIVDEILLALGKPEVRYAFVLDLLKAARADQLFQPEERVFITDIMDMMLLTPNEAAFLNAFGEAASSNDLSAANAAVQRAIEATLEPNIGHLQFFMTGFSYQEEIAGIELVAGQHRRITRPARIVGTIKVASGAILSIRGSELVFAGEAQIVVDGGVLELEGATLKAGNDSKGPLIVINASTPVFEARNCSFDGGGVARIIVTLAGKTALTDCTFVNAHLGGLPVKSPIMRTDFTSAGAAISAGGLLVLQNCSFRNCVAGSAGGAICAVGQLLIKNSSFENCQSKGVGGAVIVAGNYGISDTKFENCLAVDHGGAMYVTSSEPNNFEVSKCAFTRCVSSASGGALYIHEGVYTVTDCVFEECSASESGGGLGTDRWMQGEASIKRCSFARCIANAGGGIRIRSADHYLPTIAGTTYDGCLPNEIQQDKRGC
jgi:uncharacterized tellurite resistance protein B-like protein